MGKVLVVAEKPSVGRDIAKVLGCNKKGEGFLEGDKYIVTWAIGHLITLCKPEEYDPLYKKWTFSNLPIIPIEMKLKPVASTKKQYAIVKKLMNSKDTDYIVCATDSGREGELIFRYIYEMAGCKKEFKRLWISSMTDTAIKDGFENLKSSREYDYLYYSAKCRSEADWLVGMNASRAFSIKYNALLSIGRVQTPTLSLIVQRQREINEFVPQKFYEIVNLYDGFTGTWIDKKDNETKIFNESKAKELLNKVKGKKAKVTEVKKEVKKQPPPLLYDLTELQREANRKFGFSAQKTLSVAQDLYEKKKLITYPRTDSRYLSTDMIPKLKKIIGKLDKEIYGKYTDYIMNKDKLTITKRIVDDTKITDHHAIIPTDGSQNIKGLTQEEFKIYDLIVRRFVSVFMPDYKYTLTTVMTEVEGESFITKGKTIIQHGWTELNSIESAENDEEKNLPDIKEGEEYQIQDTKIINKETKPPKAYTEASLLSAMENAGRFIDDEELKEQLKDGGLGTPATRAGIIERLIEVGYINRKGKNLVPTEKGMKLIDIVPNELKSPETTGKWEKGLSSISKGKLDSNKFMNSIKRYVKYIIETCLKENKEVVFTDDNKSKTSKKKFTNLGQCPICKNGIVLENTKAFYCSEWKNGCKFTIWKNSLETLEIMIDAKMIKKLLKNGVIEKVEGKSPGTSKAIEGNLVFKEGFKGVGLINIVEK
ncbi:DNA topoisomerase III [Fervidicella metallireducens AeB]|uniref:DNA topoisomerase n=1 Tax=Fervidicella metallireducens AeB TaxID=1403537 RepID=A0A017RV88_9CLOT|nr:DNA topoisomerase III [Fervidicella metallireducens]EYE88562.1 DNA topoisomerase III [Fervidicella metallireducens AeB]